MIAIKEIQTLKLSDVLDKYSINTIHFMTIDVEGFDLNVLKSNNWDKYRPKVIICEFFAKDIINLTHSEINNF